MRQCRVLLGVGAVVVGYAFLAWLMRPGPVPAITWENFRRLRVGMSAKNVEALLGKPHEMHDEYEVRTLTPFPMSRSLPTCPILSFRTWRGEEVFIFGSSE
jgi:hypothetical protein